MNRWWGYLHTDGSLHAKRYFDKRDLDEARESTFVAEIMEPFDADSANQAWGMVRVHFRPETEEK